MPCAIGCLIPVAPWWGLRSIKRKVSDMIGRNDKVKVELELSLRDIRMLARAVGGALSVVRNGGVASLDQWRGMCRVSAELKCAVAQAFSGSGVGSFYTGYRLANRWADERIDGAYGSVCR